MSRLPALVRLRAPLQTPLTASGSIARRTATLLLGALMLATRQNHFGLLTDASWAVFFLGGFYVGGVTAFAAFLAEAGLIDYVATRHLGISSYCLSPAYAFLLPSYATLWLGGLGAARLWRRATPLRSLTALAAMVWLSSSLCFLISNGSFYWLSGRVRPNWDGWVANLADWYVPFLLVPVVYVGTAGIVQTLTERWRGRQTQPATA